MADTLSLRDFLDQFPDEHACWTHLREIRWGPDGFKCPTCGETEHWGVIQTRKLFQCKTCRTQTSVTAGTIFQDTKLDLWTWFLAAYLVLTTKKGISTPELARKVGFSEKTAWFVKHKIVHTLGREQAAHLFGLIEVDEAFLGGRTTGVDGRGTRKQQVLGAVEVGEDGLGRLRLAHVPNMRKGTIQAMLDAGVAKGATIHTDGWTAFQGVEGYDHHRFIPENQHKGGRELPRIHLVFSNLKRVIKGTHTKFHPDKLQAYLDEFSFRFDHRDDLGRAFSRGIGLLVSSKPLVYGQVRCAC